MTVIYIFLFFYILYTENMHYGLIHITIATNVTGWSEQMKRKYVSNLGDQI